MIKNQKGFGTILIVIILVAVALVGFAGFRVFSKSKGSDKPLVQNSNKTEEVKPLAVNAKTPANGKTQLKACELVNASDASTILGEPAAVQNGYDPNDGSAEDNIWVSLCVYQAVNASAVKSAGLVIMVIEGLSDSARAEVDAYHAALKTKGGGTNVTGLGDSAFTVAGSTVGTDSIFTKKGNIWLSTSAGFATADAASIKTYTTTDQNMQMVRLMLKKF